MDELDTNGPSKDKAADRNKRGALSSGEMKYIEENAATKSLQEMSVEISKSVGTIKKYVYKKNLVTKEDTKSPDGIAIREIQCRDILRNREYWPELQLQFSSAEVKQFEQSWVKMYLQFNEDCQWTEELQMKKYLTLEIMKDRFGRQVYTCIMEIDKLQKAIDDERAAGTKNSAAIRELSMLLEKYQSNQIQLAKQQRETIQEQKDVESKLKGSRDQRVKSYLDANENFSAGLRLLHENQVVRENLAKHIEIMRQAQEFAKCKLYDYHTFVDGTLDKLILSEESTINEENEDDDNI